MGPSSEGCLGGTCPAHAGVLGNSLLLSAWLGAHVKALLLTMTSGMDHILLSFLVKGIERGV